jgi:hypothetical protein
MNYKHLMLSLALLLSPAVYANYRDCVVSEDPMLLNCGQRAEANNDVRVALLFLASQIIPEKYPQFDCGSFKPWARVNRTASKYFVNRLFLDNGINFSVNLDQFGEVNVLNTDQALEVGWAALQGLLAKNSAQDIAKAAGKTYVREIVVGLLTYLLHQSGLKNLLPSSVTQSEVYQPIVNEIGRYEVDQHVMKLLP